MVQPRLTARWELGDSASPLKGGVGLFAQEPDIQRRDRRRLRQPGPRRRAGHPLLGRRRVQAAALASTFDVTGFYKDLDHLVSQTDATYVDATA